MKENPRIDNMTSSTWKWIFSFHLSVISIRDTFIFHRCLNSGGSTDIQFKKIIATMGFFMVSVTSMNYELLQYFPSLGAQHHPKSLKSRLIRLTYEKVVENE